MHASKTQHAERSEDLIVGETPCAAPLHLVPLAKERTSAIIDVVVDRPIGRHSRAVAEVGRPAEQKPVQPVAHLGPRFLVAGHQDVADLRLDPLYALLGRARAQVPMAVLPVALRTERVTKEVEAKWSRRLASYSVSTFPPAPPRTGHAPFGAPSSPVSLRKRMIPRTVSAFRISRTSPSGSQDTCRPSPCGRLSRPRSTTAAPSPCASRRVGRSHIPVVLDVSSAT